MKAVYALIALLFLGLGSYAQVETEEQVETVEAPEVPESPEAPEEVESDTMKMKFGKTQVLVINNEGEGEGEDEEGFDEDDEDGEEEGYEEEPQKSRRSDAHWAGIDLGFMMLLDENRENSFANNPYWKNDPAKSQVWNLNILEHKFNFGQPFVGLTTGLGFSFTSVAFRDSYLIQSSADSIFAAVDSLNSYSKNKLKATYLTAPIMLEFNTSRDESKSFYLAAGVVGGVRIASKTKRVGELDGKEFKEKVKGAYNLNPFKLDAAVRFGYADWGIFANYSLLPLFDKGKTIEIYPLTFGLSVNI